MADFSKNQNIAELRAELSRKQAEIRLIQAELNTFVSKEKGDSCLEGRNEETSAFVNNARAERSSEPCAHTDVHSCPLNGLTNGQIARYSRQLILPEIGVQGQQRLLQSSVLIVGAGGLGCPAAVYLAAAGIGELGVVDYDVVETSNLHRQILHTEARVNVSKAKSLSTACSQLNSSVKYSPYSVQLSSHNALNIIKKYDVIVDATDNVATRYLLNDACVLAGKPLVSGSALRFEGQLTVYNHDGGPCYRCIHPKPPSPDTVTNCSDGGVLGVVPGIIGTLQALEVIKLITGAGDTYSGQLLLFYALDGSFRKINLRKAKRSQCPMCGENPSIKELTDYEQFCGATANDKDSEKKLLPPESRITALEYHRMATRGTPHVLVDVRMEVERDICRLPHPALNIPLTTLQNPQRQEDCLQQLQDAVKNSARNEEDSLPVVVVCRRGNDSQIAVQHLQDKLRDAGVKVMDIKGGLHAWTRNVDPNFPMY